jgi:hypothetical protein
MWERREEEKRELETIRIFCSRPERRPFQVGEAVELGLGCCTCALQWY